MSDRTMFAIKPLRSSSRYVKQIINVHLSESFKSSAQITVRDHGRGVQEEALSLIFKPFYKIADGDERHAGAGLGLAISEAAIRMHKGTITARNADDGGLIIEIVLPIECPAASQ